MSTYLKVKFKSLAEEAKIIRIEERRVKAHSSYKKECEENEWGEQRRLLHGLKSHRKRVVRTEARATHLARGFLKGVAYKAMESKVHVGNEPNWSYIQKMAEKYGTEDKRVIAQKFAEWKSAK